MTYSQKCSNRLMPPIRAPTNRKATCIGRLFYCVIKCVTFSLRRYLLCFLRHALAPIRNGNVKRTRQTVAVERYQNRAVKPRPLGLGIRRYILFFNMLQ